MALAREWFDPIHEGKRFVNPHLSLGRALSHPKPEWDGQLVLWSGRLRKVRARGAGWSMKLETPEGTIPVICPRAVLTLKADTRENCLVAVKGEVALSGGKFHHLTGRSIILLEPSQAARPANREEYLSQRVRFHWPQEKPEFTDKVARAILVESEKNRLDPWLFSALLQIESAYSKDVVSPSGAIGMGQLMPFTAEGLAVDPWDPYQNIAGSARMLSGLLQGWNSPVDSRALALAAYNAGPTLVRQLQDVPAIPETNNYVYFIGYLRRHLKKAAL